MGRSCSDFGQWCLRVIVLVSTGLTGGTASAGPLERVAGGVPPFPLPPRESGLSFSSVIDDARGRTLAATSDTIFEVLPEGLVRRAGAGVAGPFVEACPPLAHVFREIVDLEPAPDGSIYVADAADFRVSRLDLETGAIGTLLGTGLEAHGHDDGPGEGVPLGRLSDIEVAPNGDLWLTDISNFVILRYSVSTHRLERMVGTGQEGLGEDGIPARESRIGVVREIALDDDGALWIADESNGLLRRLDPVTGTLRTHAGGGDLAGPSADGLPAIRAALRPTALAALLDGSIVFADAFCDAPVSTNAPGGAEYCAALPAETSLIRRYRPESGTLETLAGGGRAVGDLWEAGNPRDAHLGHVAAIELRQDGSVLALDGLHHRARLLDPGWKSIRTWAGSGERRYFGADRPALEALLAEPCGLLCEADGSLLFADPGADRILQVETLSGRLVVLAGGGRPADGVGDGLPAREAHLDSPRGLRRDAAGGLWIAEAGAGRVRRVDRLSGLIETVAGRGLGSGDRGDGGHAREARLLSPTDVALDPSGGFWIADPLDARVRFVDAGGTINTWAGGGSNVPEDVPAKEARLGRPSSIVFDRDLNLLIADEELACVLRVERKSGRISRVVGGGQPADGMGDGIPADRARLVSPSAIAFSPDGDLWIADRGQGRVRRVSVASGRISTAVGQGGEGASIEGTPAFLAWLGAPASLAFDGQGSLLLGEWKNHRIVRFAFAHPEGTLAPRQGPLAGGTRVHITGAGFDSEATAIRFGGLPSAEVSVHDDGNLDAVSPPGRVPAGLVDVEVETPSERWIVPGGFEYLNAPPVADADPDSPDDGYLSVWGGRLVLDAGASSDPDEAQGDTIVAYEWDLDGDGIPEAYGERVELGPADIVDFGWNHPDVYPIVLRVVDSAGADDFAATTVRLVELTLSPLSGPVAGGLPATIRGPDLAEVRRVTFGGIPALELEAGPVELRFRVPRGDPRGGPVEVAIEYDSLSLVLPLPYEYINSAPIARPDPRDPPEGYASRLGAILVLDGSRSSDPDADDAIAVHEWDLDGDGVYDRRGAKIVLQPEELASFGLDQVGEWTIVLKVTDLGGRSTTAVATLRLELPPTSFPNPEYADWDGDTDRDGIDDRLERLTPATRVDTLILHEPGTDLEARRANLAPLVASPPRVIPAIHAIALSGVLVEDVIEVAEVGDGVFRVELEDEFEATLDTSAAGVKAAPSGDYSPWTTRDRGILGRGVNVAVLDSGIDDDHPALAGRFLGGFDAFVDSLSPPGSRSNPDDDFDFAGLFHGTHMAGIVCGSDSVYGGIAPSARLLDVKVLDSLGRGTTTSLSLGLQWCIQNRSFAWPGAPLEHRGIDVVLLAVASRTRSDGKDAVSMMVDAATAAGIVVVTSSGNSAGLGAGVGAPGAADTAITVGAVDDRGTVDRSDDLVWSSSGYGPRLDDGDSDPTEELKPDLVAPGVAVVAPTGNIAGQPAAGFDAITGSSAAAAHAAGVAALVLGEVLGAEPSWVKRALRQSSEGRGEPWDPSLDRSWNEHYGKGLLDAYRSLPRDLNNANLVWVSSRESDSLSAFRPDSPGALVSGSPYTIGGGRGPHGIAVDGKGNVWLANRSSASVTKLNSAGQLRFHIPLGPIFGVQSDLDIGAIALDRAGDAWVTLESEGEVVRIAASGSTDLIRHAVGAGPRAIAIGPSGSIWVANSLDGTVTQLDSTGAESPGSPFALGEDPRALVCDRVGRLYAALRGNDSVTVLSPDGSFIANLPAGRRPVEITLDFEGGIWVSNDLEATLTRLDPWGAPPLQVIVGAGPRGLAVAGDGTIWTSVYTLGLGTQIARVSPAGALLERLSVDMAPLNHGDGTGFVHANSVDPDGDADADDFTNAEEIDAGTNPFRRDLHPVELSRIVPAQGSVLGGTIARIEGRGVRPPIDVRFGGRTATLRAVVPQGVEVFVPEGEWPPSGPVDVAAERPEGEASILAGAFQYLDSPPVADADPDPSDRGYVIHVGDTLTLDGTGSFDPDASLGDTIASWSWTLAGAGLSGITRTLDPAELASLGLDVPGHYELRLEVEDSLGIVGGALSSVTVLDGVARRFLRAESNADGAINIADPIFTVNWLFLGGTPPTCLDACDSNGDFKVDIADPVHTVNWLFLGGVPPPRPFPLCGAALPVLGCDSSYCP